MKKALAVSALLLVLLPGLVFGQSPDPVPVKLDAIQSKIDALTTQVTVLTSQVASLANKEPRKFYLSKTPVDGAHALTACAAGYHMASMWEIHEPSNLRYNTELGVTREDSGFGPPTVEAAPFGWIRTGSNSNSDTFTLGTDNCYGWTGLNLLNGTLAGLPYNWITNPTPTTIGPWLSSGDECNQPHPVWCVQD